MGDHWGTMAGILNIGEMGALALHILTELALLRQENPEGRHTVQHIAGDLQASAHTLQKVARRLIMMQLIEGTRGAAGGLRLVANPKRITLLQVLEGVEGKFNSNGCMFAKRVCPSRARCAFAGVTENMEKMVREYFAATTIAELCSVAAQPA